MDAKRLVERVKRTVTAPKRSFDLAERAVDLAESPIRRTRAEMGGSLIGTTSLLLTRVIVAITLALGMYLILSPVTAFHKMFGLVLAPLGGYFMWHNWKSFRRAR